MRTSMIYLRHFKYDFYFRKNKEKLDFFFSSPSNLNVLTYQIQSPIAFCSHHFSGTLSQLSYVRLLVDYLYDGRSILYLLFFQFLTYYPEFYFYKFNEIINFQYLIQVYVILRYGKARFHTLFSPFPTFVNSQIIEINIGFQRVCAIFWNTLVE